MFRSLGLCFAPRLKFLEKLGVTLWKEKKSGSDIESANALVKHQLIDDESGEESDEDDMLMKKRVLPPVTSEELELVKPVSDDIIIVSEFIKHHYLLMKSMVLSDCG